MLDRAELYEKVWTIPMRTLAKEFGLSDVGLAKLCRRHNIPLPGRGYWARIQFGQKIARPVLPALGNTEPEIVEISRHEADGTDQQDPKEQLPIPTVEVSNDREISHPVVKRIENSLSRSKKDERGFLLTKQGRLVPLTVSAEALPRTLRILDVLFSVLEEHNCKLEWPTPYNTPLYVVIEGEKLSLSVTEAVERSPHAPTDEELARKKKEYWWNPPRSDYRPTGRLKLEVSSLEFPEIRDKWWDRKWKSLEKCLGEAVVTCETSGRPIRRERELRAEAERQRAEEEKREAEAAIRRAEYKRKAGAIKKLSQEWHESELIRGFVTALRAATGSAELSEDSKRELQSMIDWSASHADYVDPLTDLNWTVDQFKNEFWY